MLEELQKLMKNIVKNIENLEKGKYEIYYREKGIFEDVNIRLNNLSDKLKSNEIERKKLMI